MLDETLITETPPLYSCYGHIGEQVRVPITGNRSKRILHGAINIKTGDIALLITKEWTKPEHQGFLSMIRSQWRGWNIVLFEDRAGQHTSPESLEWAEELERLTLALRTPPAHEASRYQPEARARGRARGSRRLRSGLVR
jgi:hypothetical protein